MPLDRLILCLVVIVLIGTGMVMIYNATDIQAGEQSRYKDSHYFLKQQMMFLGIGVVAFFLVTAANYRWMIKFGWLFLLGAIGLLALVYTSLGVEVNGARRWLDFRIIRVQPAEIASYSTILFLVYMLSRKQRKMNSFFAAYVPMMIGTSIVLGLIVLQPNLSLTILIGSTALLLLFIGGVKPIHILYTVIAAIPFALILMLQSDYLLDRFHVWQDPFRYAGAKGLQPVESMVALGVGGLRGVGLGMSRQKLYFLPYCHNDFIGAIIGEETGFVGMMFLLLLYVALAVCGLIIAMKVKDIGGYLLASGITVLITMQGLIHLGVVTASIPPTGVNLPFISYGGSNLIMNCIGIGILVNISRSTELQPKDKFTVQGPDG